MGNHVLVAYASKHGATEEIAKKIGDVLQQAGLSVEVKPAGQVKDLAPYQAVVLGSGVYVGQWRKQAARFLKANEQALAEKMVWIFSSGPTGEGDVEKLLPDWTLPKSLLPVADHIQPRDVTVFHGAMDPNRLNFIEKWMIKQVNAPTGDFRDWDAVAAWATSIAEALK